MNGLIRLFVSFHAFLLRLYPRRFRDEFSEEMSAVFAMAAQEAARRRKLSATVVWLRELRDLPVSLAYQYWSTFRNRESKMTAVYKRPERFFIPGWVIVSTIGILIAFVITWATVSIIEGIIGGTMQVGDHTSPTEDVLMDYIFFPVLGLSTGFFQWLLLRRYLPRIGRWILATFLGWLLAVAVLFVLYTFILQAASPDSVWVLGLTFIVIGGSIGSTQWLVLHRRIEKASLWILANIISWTLLRLVIGKSITNTLEIAALALIPAVVTGVALWLLMRLSKGGGLSEEAIVVNRNTDTKDPHRKSPGLQRQVQAGLIDVPGPMMRP